MEVLRSSAAPAMRNRRPREGAAPGKHPDAALVLWLGPRRKQPSRVLILATPTVSENVRRRRALDLGSPPLATDSIA